MTRYREPAALVGLIGTSNEKSDRRDRIRSTFECVAYLLLGALTLSPLLWAKIPPLVDYPNHLARMAILAHVGNSAVANNYIPDWRLLPNLAMDLIVPLLAHILPLDIAGRLFIAAAISLLVIGTALLRRTLHGKVGLWPLCSFLFTYNAVLWFGFLNYLFALGVAIISFAGWISSARWQPISRAVVFSAVAAFLFILHLFALGVFGLLIGSFEVGKFLRDRDANAAARRFALLLVVFMPSGLMWLWSVGHGGPTYVSYGSVNDRLVAFLAPVSFNYKPSVFDLFLFAVTIIAVGIGFVSRSISVMSQMRVPLCALILGSVFMPEWAQGSWAASFRLPIVVPFVFIASVLADEKRTKITAPVVLVSLVFLCTRVGAVTEMWRDLNQQFSEFRLALRAVPVGARLFTVHGPMPWLAKGIPNVPRELQTLEWVNYSHLSALAIIDRGAFIPSLFTDWYSVRPSVRNQGLSRFMTSAAPSDLEDLQKLASASPTDTIKLPRNVLGELPCCLDWPHTYQFVVWIDFGHVPRGIPKNLEPWSAGAFFHIYRIVPGFPAS